jgi:hypothetical protein
MFISPTFNLAPQNTKYSTHKFDKKKFDLFITLDLIL